MPASRGPSAAAREEPDWSHSLFAGIAPHWRFLEDQDALGFQLGGSVRSGSGLIELRHEWIFHPVGYMTSVEKSGTLSVGWTVPWTPIRLMAGVCLCDDYRYSGWPLAVRWELSRLDLEGFAQVGEVPGLGMRAAWRFPIRR